METIAAYLLVWQVLGMPKKECKHALDQERASVAAQLYEVTKTTENIPAVTALRDKLHQLPEDPKVIHTFLMEKPKPDAFGPCHTVYATQVKLPLLK